MTATIENNRSLSGVQGVPFCNIFYAVAEDHVNSKTLSPDISVKYTEEREAAESVYRPLARGHAKKQAHSQPMCDALMLFIDLSTINENLENLEPCCVQESEASVNHRDSSGNKDP